MKYYNIIGGVNGVGKSSFTGAIKGSRADLGIIIDVDAITATLGGDPVRGGKEAIRRIDSCLDRGITFTQETTLSGFRTERTARKAAEAGYTVRLFYIGLNSAAESVERVQNRVKHGGHSIDTADIDRRFAGRWEAVAKILPFCHTGEFYDNGNGFQLVGLYQNGELLPVGENRPEWFAELMNHLRDD